jgi:two-component system, OmpR family, response regulator
MQNNRNSGLVLVVDDEWWVRAFIRLGLEEAGFAVVEAPDAETALAVIDTAPVRVLVTDLNLGPGPDGFALAAAAQLRCPDLPTLYVSGDPDRFHQRIFAGWERFVPKPFPLATVIRAVSEMAALPVRDRPRPSLWAAQTLKWVPSPPGVRPTLCPV